MYHQENNGCAARNLKPPKVKEKYIYLDAYDFIELNAFKKFYDLVEEKIVDFIICRAINYNSDTDEFKKRIGNNEIHYQLESHKTFKNS